MILGYEQITSITGAKGLTPPVHSSGARPSWAMIQTETQAVRYRIDGTAPTSSVGMRLQTGQTLFLNSDFDNFKVIEETATAKVNVTYGTGNKPELI